MFGGVVVCSFFRSTEMNESLCFTPQYFKLFYKSFGRQGVDRKVCQKKGFSMYTGLRSKVNEASSSPLEGIGSSNMNQYYREKWNPWYQVLLERVTNGISDCLQGIPYNMDPLGHHFLNDHGCGG